MICSYGGDNVLAVYVDSNPNDGSWWYIGGGINRHVWLTIVSSPGPFLTPDGIYVPSNATGPIS